MAERQPSKLEVASSNIACSRFLPNSENYFFLPNLIKVVIFDSTLASNLLDLIIFPYWPGFPFFSSSGDYQLLKEQ